MPSLPLRAAAAAALATVLAAGTSVAQHAHGGSAATPASCPVPPGPPPLADTAATAPVIASGADGVLRVRLRIVPGRVRIGDTVRVRNLYAANEGPPRYLPPTLRLNPGDSLDLTVTNCMSATADTFYSNGRTATNFHFHGFNVTPAIPHGDQVVRVLYDVGQAHRYAFRLPRSHPMGMHWYHPHPHGPSDAQVGGGMSGVILVGDVRGRIPGGSALAERTILIKDYQPWGPQHSGGSIFTVNGTTNARFTIARGDRQVWHVGNVGSDTPMGLALVGPGGRILPVTILARDGNPVAEPERADSLRLWPAERYDLLVHTNAPAGTRYALVNTDPAAMGHSTQSDTLGWLTVTAGHARSYVPPRPDPAARARIDSIRRQRPDTTRTWVFEENPNAEQNGFWINGRAYEHDTIDVRIPLGRMEEWTLINRPSGNTDPHVFHIHQGDFLVVSVNGKPVNSTSFQDRVDLASGDTVVVRIPFYDPWQVGLYVFHCHILFHEDNGMMRNICVYDPKNPRTACPAP